MSDLLEQDLRGALADRAAFITPEVSARLRAVDYRPRSRRSPSRSTLAALGVTAAAAAAAAAVLLGSSAGPAFAGWTASPTAPTSGQLAAAEHACGTGAENPVLADTRGPYTALIDADGSTCLTGNGFTISSHREDNGTPSVPAGTIQLNGVGESQWVSPAQGHRGDTRSDANALTMVYGPIGAGVTGVRITRSNGSSVQATVENGWYLAWWPGSERATTAHVVSAGAIRTQFFPTGPNGPAPPCPAGGHCSSGYGFESAPSHGAGQSTLTIGSGSGGQ